MTFGVWEIAFILTIVLVIFGAGRLSEVGGAVGKGIREFRRPSTSERAAPAPPRAAQSAPLPAAPTVPTVGVENKCPSCGTVNPTGQAFCGQCGTRLTLVA